MFRAVPCSSSGEQIVLLEHLVSSLSVNGRTVRRLRAGCPITIYMLHYNPQHVSSSTLHIFRRTNYNNTAFGIVTFCKQPYSMPVESGLQSALNRHTVRPFIESEDTRCCNNTICPPEDEHSTARNMLRIIM